MNLSWIPWQLREAVHETMRWPERQKFRRVRAGLVRSPKPEPHLGFGGALGDGRPIHGGAVKLLPLRRAFPGSDDECNLLYAVSSSPPKFCDDLFRRCAQAGVSVVWNQNGVAFPAWRGAEGEGLNGPMRRRRAQAAFVIYQSEFCRRSAERFLGPDARPSEVLFNPVDLAVYHPAPPREVGASVRLLAAGTHATPARVLAPLDALVRLRRAGLEATLTIAGRFDWDRGESEIRAAIAARGMEKFVNRVEKFSQETAAALYRAHDLLVHPKYMDPCPTVVIEALACGLPVVGSRSGGLPEMVPAEAGRLIGETDDWFHAHPPDGAEIARAVGEVVPRLAEFSAAARRHAERHFDVGRWVERHREIFQRVLS